MSETTDMESSTSLCEGPMCFGVRFRLGFKTDWDDVTGDIDDNLDDATLPRMNLMSLWSQDKAQLDLLLKEHQTVEKSSDTEEGDIKSLLGFNKGISRSHWTSKNSKNQCNCGKKFSLKVRSHHCRRCGDIFCKPCTAYRRKLNKIAHPDPNGKLYKVCKLCFDKGPQEVGQTRSLSSLYVQWREAVHHPDNDLTGDAVDGRVVFTESDMTASCDRLKQAFSKDIQATGIKRTAKEIRLIVSKPKWLKYQAEDTTTNCTLCDKKFGGLVTRKHCSFCRGTVCKACSDKNVILYVPDEDKEAVQISVIKVIGCPEKEPDVCVYLRACHSCIKLLQGSQVSDHNQHYQDEEFSQIATTEEKLIKIQEQIDQGLVELQELIESFEDDSKGPPNKGVLNKKQNELTDLFTDLVMTTHGMKSFTPSTKSHEIILSNIIRYRCEYYQETMQTFRDLKMKIKELTN